MTELPPARIVGYFAKEAPICIIERRGPSRYTQLIRWKTDTDDFEQGQWIKGKIDYLTLTRDGRYMAVGIMGKTQHSFISRPPYFTALEAWIGGLCMNAVAFDEDDGIISAERCEHVVHAKSKCPFQRRSQFLRYIRFDHDYVIYDGGELIDQQDRPVLFRQGRIYASDPEGPRLLYDTNPNRFQPVVAPDWATDW